MFSERKQKNIIILIFIMTLLLLKDQIAFTRTENQTEKPCYGGTLRIGMFIKPTIIHPMYTIYSRSIEMVDLIFSRLVQVDQDSNPIPDLAERWDVSSDGLVYTFYLRRGVKFHDGVECTAEDVEFTYQAIIDPRNESPYRTIYLNVEKFKAVSPYIFQITLKTPLTTFLIDLTREVLPEHLFKEKELKNENFLNNPIGTGPFIFKGKDQSGRIILEANKYYYNGRPYLDRIIFKPIKANTINEISLFREEIDMINFLSFAQFQYIKKDSTFKGYAVELDFYYALVYDLGDTIFEDKRIRYAIAHGISQERLIREAVRGYGKPCHGIFHQSSFGYNPDFEPISYNPEEAVCLLEECGYTLNGSDLYRKKEGIEIELRIAANIKDANHQNIIKNIILQLAEIGIKASYIPYDEYSKFVEDIGQNQKMPNVYLSSFCGGADPYYPSSYWYSKLQRNPKIAIYRNNKIDFLIEKGLNIPNSLERKEIYQKIHKIIYEDQPACFLFFHYDFHAVRRQFKNTDAYFSKDMPTYAIKDFYVKQ